MPKFSVKFTNILSHFFVSEMSNPNDGAGPSKSADPETQQEREEREAREAYYFSYLQAPPSCRDMSQPSSAHADEHMDEVDGDDADAGDEHGWEPDDDAGAEDAGHDDDDAGDPEYYGGDDVVEDTTTTSGAETADDTGATEARRLARSERRRRNRVPTVKETFDEVDISGLPTKPDTLCQGVRQQLCSNTTSDCLDKHRRPEGEREQTLGHPLAHEAARSVGVWVTPTSTRI